VIFVGCWSDPFKKVEWHPLRIPRSNLNHLVGHDSKFQSLELSTFLGRSDPIFAGSHVQSKALKTQDVCEEDSISCFSDGTQTWSFGLIIAFYHLSFFGWWFQLFFCFHPHLRKISNLTSIFVQMGWFNRQPSFWMLRWFSGSILLFKWCGEDDPKFVWRIPTPSSWKARSCWTSALKALNEFGSFRVRFWVDVAWVQDRYCEFLVVFSVYISLGIFLKISWHIGNLEREICFTMFYLLY